LNGTVPIAYPLFMATLPAPATRMIDVEGPRLGTSDPPSLAYNRVSRPMFPLAETSEWFAMRDSQESAHV